MSQYACQQPGLMDAATAAAMPVLAVPRDGVFQPLAEPGRRLLVAGDGLYIEARSRALYTRARIGGALTPYGMVGPSIELVNGPLPQAMMIELTREALAAHPHEMAALVIATAAGGYALLKRGHGEESRIRYADDDYDESMLVVDAHSHGVYPAVFSSTDDASDQSRIGPHLSYVLGRCDSHTNIEASARLCVGNYLIPISLGEATQPEQDVIV